MARVGAGFSGLGDPRSAADEAASQALSQADLERAESALVWTTASHADRLGELLDTLRGRLGTELLVGCTARGALARGRDAEETHGLAVLALAGVGATPLRLPDLAGRERDAGAALVAGLDPSRPPGLVLLLVDPTRLAQRPLLASLAEACPVPVVGAGSGAGPTAPGLVWSGGPPFAGGAVGLALEGKPTVLVTQACRSVTSPLTVTGARGHWVERLDGRPALDVYEEVARAPLARDLRRAASFVLVGLPVGPGSLERGEFRVRNVVGFSRERRSFAIPEMPGRGEELVLVLRDPEGARDSLRSTLEHASGLAASFGLYLDCVGRGHGLFGVPGLEAGYLDGALPGLPLAGMLGPFQLAPVRGRLELLTYTGVLALLEA